MRFSCLKWGKPLKISKLAREVIRFLGYKPDVDIPMVITQLEGGEKLYEELVEAREQMAPTNREKIIGWPQIPVLHMTNSGDI